LSTRLPTLPARHLATAAPRSSPETTRSRTIRPPRAHWPPLLCTRALDPWLLPRDHTPPLHARAKPLCPLAPAQPSVPASQSRSPAAVEMSRRPCQPEPQDKVRRSRSVRTASVKLAGIPYPLGATPVAISACPGDPLPVNRSLGYKLRPPDRSDASHHPQPTLIERQGRRSPPGRPLARDPRRRRREELHRRHGPPVQPGHPHLLP